MNVKRGTIRVHGNMHIGMGLVSLAIGALWLAFIGPSAWAQGADPAIASAEAPMVNSPSDSWGQSAAPRVSSSRAEAVSGGSSAINVDLASTSPDEGVSAASRAGATRGPTAPTDPAPAEDIAVAAGPAAGPVVQKSAGASAGSGSPATASAPGAARALPVTSPGDHDGPPSQAHMP